VRRRIGFWGILGWVLFMTSLMTTSDPPGAFSQSSPARDSFGLAKSKPPKKAPPFSLKTLGGKQITLDELKGKYIMLKFWATWCPSCVEELQPIQKFSEGNKDQLVILLPAIDGEKENKVRRCTEKHKITLPVLLDPKAKTARAYGVNFVPVSFFINPQGLIVGTAVGERDWISPRAWSAVKELLDLR